MKTENYGPAQICDPCTVEGNQNEAVGYCETCTEFLCQECFQIHLRLKPCRNYKLLTKNEMPTPRSMCATPSLSNKQGKHLCVDHLGEMVEYFCKEHNVLGCSACMTLNHLLCNTCYVHEAYDYIPLIEMPEYKMLKADTEELASKIQKGQGKIKALKDQATHTGEKAVKAVTSLRNKLVKEIDKSQTVILQQIKQIKKDDVKNMDSILSDFKIIENGLKQMEKDLVDQKKCKGKEAHLVVTKMVDTLQKLQKSFQQIANGQTEVKSYHFQPSASFLKAFQKELKTFGSIDIKPTLPSAVKTPRAQSKPLKTSSTEEKSSATLSDEQIGGNIEPKATGAQPNTAVSLQPVQKVPTESVKISDGSPNPLQKVPTESATGTGKSSNPSQAKPAGSVKGEYVTEFYIRTVADKQTSTITDMTLIETQKMAACDFQNCCIKIIDLSNSQYEMILKMQLQSQPFGVTFTGQELAVTLPYLGMIGMFNDIKNFQFYRNIAVGAECRGIAYRDEKFFISYNTSPGMIRIIKTTGEVLRSLTMVGGDIFQHPCHIATHPSLPTVYISDWQVIALGFDGSLVRKHRDAEFKDLRGINVSIDGIVYVCDRERNTIYFISPTTTSSQIFLDAKQGINGPHALLVTGKKNKKELFVSMEGSDYIKVFIISRTEN